LSESVLMDQKLNVGGIGPGTRTQGKCVPGATRFTSFRPAATKHASRVSRRGNLARKIESGASIIPERFIISKASDYDVVGWIDHFHRLHPKLWQDCSRDSKSVEGRNARKESGLQEETRGIETARFLRKGQVATRKVQEALRKERK